MPHALTIAILVAYILSVYGWGRLVARWAFADAPRALGLSVALGLVVLIFIGGIANLARIAYPATLDVLVVLGWLLCAADLYSARTESSSRDPGESEKRLVVFVVLFCILVLSSTALLPSRTINIFDDFFLYLVSPVRALQTGTLAGNPFEGSGATTLGAQSFLQSFVLAHFDLDYLPAFDNVFCFVLTLALIADFSRRIGSPFIVQILCVLGAAIFNPQIVNTSATYSASALSLAFVMVLTEADGLEDKQMRRRALFAVGASAAAVVCLKSTLALYAGTTGLAFMICLGFARRDWSTSFKDGGIAALGGIVLLLPWILVHVGDYEVLWKLHLTREAIAPGDPSSATLNEPGLSALLTDGIAFLGGSLRAYAIVFATIGAGAVAAFWHLRRAAAPRTVALDVVVLANAAGFFATFVVIQQSTELSMFLSYMAPLSIVGLAVTAAYCAPLPEQGPLRVVLGAAVPLVVGIMFFGSFTNRVDWAIRKHTQIAFESGREPPVFPYLEATLAHNYDSWIGDVQKRIPEHAGILTWHPFAFLMDFRRNPIFTLNDGSHHNPLFAFPAGDFDRTSEVLRDIGVRYVVWEHTGLQHVTQTRQNWPAMVNSRYTLARTQAQSMLRTNAYMQFLARQGTPFYADGRIAVFDLGPGTTTR